MGHKVGIIGGDGIGPEVIGEALKVIAAAGALNPFPPGQEVRERRTV